MNRLKLTAGAKRAAVAAALMSVVLQVLLVGSLLGQVHAMA
jgi:hypothetical protein